MGTQSLLIVSILIHKLSLGDVSVEVLFMYFFTIKNTKTTNYGGIKSFHCYDKVLILFFFRTIILDHIT